MKTLHSISINIVNHCNLNCKYCDHFAPIAIEGSIAVDNFEKDIKKLKEIAQDNILSIDLMGGEPLLHPSIIRILDITRKYFQNSDIFIFTNGILLKDLNEDFWQSCRQNNISITISKYPINLNIEWIEKKCAENNINLDYYTNPDSEIKTMNFVPLDLRGLQDKEDSFAKCFQAKKCVMFNEGRIYTCSLAANIKHFNKYFKKNISQLKKDSISIYDVKELSQIINYLNAPISLCKYCNINARELSKSWELSELSIDEWVK